MTDWYAERTPSRSAKAVIAVTLFALLLVAAVPVALLAGVVVMVLGHVVGGLALFGGSIEIRLHDDLRTQGGGRRPHIT